MFFFYFSTRRQMEILYRLVLAKVCHDNWRQLRFSKKFRMRGVIKRYRKGIPAHSALWVMIYIYPAWCKGIKTIV